ncbi:MAG: hypothetical protein U0Y82_01460 [Thermoleophilia bacterium]
MRISRAAALAAATMLGGTAVAVAQTDPGTNATLRGRLPATVVPFCATAVANAPNTILGATAQQDCDLPTSIGVIAHYATFATSDALSAAYPGVLRRAGLPGDATDIGGCTGTTSIGEHVYADANGPAGRLACSLQDGGIGTPPSSTPADPHAHVVWTSTDSLTLVWATRNDVHLDRLVTDWLPKNLPTPPITTQSLVPPPPSNAGLFPNTAERTLIRSLSVNIDHSSCARVTHTASDVWAMGVQCGIPVSQGGGGIVIRAFTKADQAKTDFVSVLRLHRPRKTNKKICQVGAGSTAKVFRSNKKPVGSFLCFTSNGKVRLDWYDSRQAVHGTIIQPGRDLKRLFLWWQANVRQR